MNMNFDLQTLGRSFMRILVAARLTSLPQPTKPKQSKLRIHNDSSPGLRDAGCVQIFAMRNEYNIHLFLEIKFLVRELKRLRFYLVYPLF